MIKYSSGKFEDFYKNCYSFHSDYCKDKPNIKIGDILEYKSDTGMICKSKITSFYYSKSWENKRLCWVIADNKESDVYLMNKPNDKRITIIKSLS